MASQFMDLPNDRPDPSLPRGTNQAGMRDYNERLVLSLVRQNGALATTTPTSVSSVCQCLKNMVASGRSVESFKQELQ